MGAPLNPDQTLDALRNDLANLVEAHPPQEWSPALLRAVVGVLTLHFEDTGLTVAPVLTLVKS